MRQPINIAVLVAISFPAIAQAQTPATPPRPGVFMCAESASGGVRYNENSKLWEGTEFQGQNRFLVRIDLVRQRTVFGKPGERPIIVGGDYRVTVSTPAPVLSSERHPCVPNGGNSDLVAIDAKSEVACRTRTYDLLLRLHSNRFTLFNQVGFIEGRNNGGPFVSVGTCSRTEG